VSSAKIKDQIREAKEFADKHGWKLSNETFEDLGVSAFKELNLESDAALQRFRAGVEEKKIKRGSILIVEQLDRLSRAELLTAMGIFIGLLNSKITIATLIDGQIFDPSEDQDALFSQLMLSLGIFKGANMESVKTSIRVKKSWRRKLEAQKFLTSRCPFWLIPNKKTKSYKIDLSWKKKIKDIFQMAVSGKGKRVICNELTKQEVPTPKGKSVWPVSTVGKLLHDRSLLGWFQPHEMRRTGRQSKRVAVGEPFPLYPPIIDEKLFNEAQVALANRKITGRKTRSSDDCKHLFDGLLTCGYDGSSVHFINKGIHWRSKTRETWLINRKGRDRQGPSYSWRYDNFEEQFLEFFSLLRYDNVLQEQSDEKREESKSKLNTLKTDLLDYQQRQRNLMVLAEDGSNETQELKKRFQQLKDGERKTKEEIEAIERENYVYDSSQTDWVKDTSKIFKNYKRRAKSTKFRFELRNFIRSLVEGIELYPKGLLWDEDMYKKVFKYGSEKLLQEDFGDPDCSSRVSSDYCLKELNRAPNKLLLTPWALDNVKKRIAADIAATRAKFNSYELKKWRSLRSKTWKTEMAGAVDGSSTIRNRRYRCPHCFFIVRFKNGAKRIFINNYIDENGISGKGVFGVQLRDETMSARLIDIQLPATEKKKGVVTYRIG